MNTNSSLRCYGQQTAAPGEPVLYRKMAPSRLTLLHARECMGSITRCAVLKVRMCLGGVRGVEDSYDNNILYACMKFSKNEKN